MTTFYGDALFKFIISWWILSEMGDTSILGSVYAIGSIASILVNLVSGYISDKYNQKYSLIIMDLFSGSLCILGFILLKEINIKLLVILVFCLNITKFSVSIISKSIIKSLFSKEHRLKFNSQLEFIKSFAKLSGPLIGGWLVLIVSPRFFLLINGITFIISALCECFLIYDKRIYENKEFNLFGGFKYIIQNKSILYCIILCAIFNFFLVGLEIFIPALAVNYYKSSWTLSIFQIAQSAGALSAPFILSYLSKKITSEIKILKIAALLASISLVFSALVNSAIISGALFLNSMFVTIFNIIFFTYLQNNSEEEYIGRIISSTFIIVGILTPIGNYIWGNIGNILNEYSILFIGIGLTFISIIFYSKFKENKYEKNINNN